MSTPYETPLRWQLSLGRLLGTTTMLGISLGLYVLGGAAPAGETPAAWVLAAAVLVGAAGYLGAGWNWFFIGSSSVLLLCWSLPVIAFVVNGILRFIDSWQ